MRDPLPPIPFLANAVQPLADDYGFQVLPLHIHEILGAAALYTFIHVVFSPWVSKKYFPKYYPTDVGKKANWDTHVVSMVQSILICSVALYVHFNDEERKNMGWEERVWGYTGASTLVEALAAGYFLWDVVVTIIHYKVFGPGLLAHGVSALLVYSFGFRPYLNYYSTVFILYEISTPFLNIHWFCDKLDMTGSDLQLYNGLILLGTFFGARLVWGTTMSVHMIYDAWRSVWTAPSTEYMSVSLAQERLPGEEDVMLYAKEAAAAPLWLFMVYFLSNATLNYLNIIWFRKMIKAIQKRFDDPPQNGTVADKTEVVDEKTSLSSGTTSGNLTTGTDGLRQRGAPMLHIEKSKSGASLSELS